jgi:hypothetical protein
LHCTADDVQLGGRQRAKRIADYGDLWEIGKAFIDVAFAVPVGNPLDEAATIDLRARPLDLPADWAVFITPTSATLDPGATMTATVTLIPGTAVVQGAATRVAIEGYVGDELIGGLVLALGVPQERSFDGKLHLYVPQVER